VTVVVDASLALKWVLEEEYTEEALALRNQWRVTGQAVIAPSIFRSEVTNALHQSCRHGHLSRSDAAEALDILLSLVAIRDPIELYSRALVLAGDMALGSTYDALYVALAESEGCDMWTADQRLVRSIQTLLPQIRDVTESP
jgi:predicted nucleic acid-binding protein